MNYRLLGNTGFDVSVIGFGASSLGSVFREVTLADSTNNGTARGRNESQRRLPLMRCGANGD